MRIIGGEAKGKRIYLPKGGKIRPTSDMIKESLFNSLYAVEGKSFLDLFAGCGSVGLEALSRGAARVLFIENNLALVNAIKRNITNFHFESKAEVLGLDADKGLRQLSRRGERFHVLFADPPYEKGFVEKVLRIISESDLVADDGTFIIQHSLREESEMWSEGRCILRERKRFGDTVLSFFTVGRKE
jgi:16S rRNA (guanine966-N2)-methyltransferase